MESTSINEEIESSDLIVPYKKLKKNSQLFDWIRVILHNVGLIDFYCDKNGDIFFDGNKSCDTMAKYIYSGEYSCIVVHNFDCQNIDPCELRKLFFGISMHMVDAELYYLYNWRISNISYGIVYTIFIFDGVELFKKFLSYYTEFTSLKSAYIELKPNNQLIMDDYDWKSTNIKFSECPQSPNCLKGISSLVILENYSSYDFLQNNNLMKLQLEITNGNYINILNLCTKLVHLDIAGLKLSKSDLEQICKNTSLKTLIINKRPNDETKLIDIMEIVFTKKINDENQITKLAICHIESCAICDTFLKILDSSHNTYFKIPYNTMYVDLNNLIKLLEIIKRNNIRLHLKCKIINDPNTSSKEQYERLKSIIDDYLSNHQCSYFMYKSCVEYIQETGKMNLSEKIKNAYKIQGATLVKYATGKKIIKRIVSYIPCIE